MPVIDAQVIRAPKFFWTDQESYDRYLAYIADPDVPVLLDGAPADQAKTMNGLRNGHSSRKEAEFEAMRAQAVDLAPLATPAPEWLVAPPVLRSTHPAQTAGASDACLACGHPTLLRDGAGRPRCWSHKWPNGRPPAPKVTAGRCDAGATPCGAPARLYPAGWLCDGHRPGRR
jgi:hypothetical protein